jgi:hypothetical protein
MLRPGHAAGALTRETALALLEEVSNLRAESDRHRVVVAQVRQLLNSIDV